MRVRISNSKSKLGLTRDPEEPPLDLMKIYEQVKEKERKKKLEEKQNEA